MPGKVAVICDNYPVRSETFVTKHAQLLSADVYAFQTHALDTIHPGAPRFYPIAIRPGQGLARLYFEKIYRRLAGSPWRLWLNADQKRLKALLGAAGVDSVLVEFGQCFIGCSSALLAGPWKTVPHFHGVDLSKYLRDARYVAKLRAALAGCTDAIVVNRVMEKRLREILGFKGRIHHIPCGVDENLFTRSRPPGNPEPGFLFVGRLIEKKGVAETIRAFAQFLKMGGKGILTIAGDGPCAKTLHDLVANESLDDKVHFTGPVSHEDVVRLMKESDVYVQHSKTSAEGDEEGWPVAIAEACATGLPVIATLHAGIPEQVIHRVTGILVNEGDIAAMAEGMLELSQSKSLRETMGEKARQHILPFCASAVQREKLLAVLQRN